MVMGVGTQQQLDEGETDCHMDCDKGSYTVILFRQPLRMHQDGNLIYL